ncbi:hypothetical protein [Serratia fonticola]
MYTELLTKDELWKTLGAILPIAAAVWKVLQSIFQFFKTSKITQLKNYYKEYGEHLSAHQKLYISKELRKRVMKQLTGLNNSRARQHLIFIMGRLDLKLPQWQINHLLRFLKFNGVRFYFEINRRYKRRAFLARFTSVLYFLYTIFLVWAYFWYDGLSIDLMGTIVLALVCVCFSIFLMIVYPTRNKMMAINGRLLTLDCSDYRNKEPQ